MWKFSSFYNSIAAIDDKDNKVSYRELDELGENLYKNINERTLVFQMCTNTIGSLIGYTSFLNNKIVPLLLSHDLEFGLLSGLIDIYKPSYLWVPEKNKNDLSQYVSVYECYGYCLLKTGYEVNKDMFSDLGLLLTTSGSTGSPKLVRQSYGNLIANTQSIVDYLEINNLERAITTLPMNYTYGLSIINTHLYAGATVLLTEKSIFDRDFWSFFKDKKATSFGGVPYTYEMLNKLRFISMDLPSLRYMTQAGGKLSPEMHKKFATYALSNDKRFIVMYGQTEATARMAYLPSEKSLEKYGSMGIAIPGGKFSLVDVNGNEIENYDEVGELRYTGKNVTLGYAESSEDLKKADERQGVLLTGDMAKRDNNGFYYIVGRKKRFLKMFGKRINLDEIEQLVKSEFADIQCACTGIDDEMFVFITDEKLLKDVERFLSHKTGLNKRALIVRTIDKIPKNESGKTIYSKLQLI